MNKIVCLFALMLLFASTARADNTPDYVVPNWNMLIAMLAERDALNFTEDPTLLDEYGMIAHCDLYVNNFQNEFKWQEARRGLLDELRKHKDYPLTFIRYESNIQLDRYDFDAKLFRFTKKTVLDGINAFMFTGEGDFRCNRLPIVYLPHDFRALLTHPIVIKGLPMEPEAGAELLKAMDIQNNTERTIYARFNMRITHVQALVRYMKHDQQGKEIYYYMQGRFPSNPVQMDADLDSVEFFADREMKLKLYTYKP